MLGKSKKILLLAIIIVVILTAVIICSIVSKEIASIEPLSLEYYYLLQHPYKIRIYKATHEYLDDVVMAAQYIEGFNYIGYSEIWKTLCIAFAADEARYYANLPMELLRAFKNSNYSWDYFNEHISENFSYTTIGDLIPKLQEQYISIS